eukprot:959427_1
MHMPNDPDSEIFCKMSANYFRRLHSYSIWKSLHYLITPTPRRLLLIVLVLYIPVRATWSILASVPLESVEPGTAESCFENINLPVEIHITTTHYICADSFVFWQKINESILNQ